jgi:hypothetical protein
MLEASTLLGNFNSTSNFEESFKMVIIPKLVPMSLRNEIFFSDKKLNLETTVCEYYFIVEVR